ncbi:MAG: penicillin-insensitive murein endopeptidase [Myxococcota bacterium]|nr:penicillin-insensitive murein endopeptidase [Myxococcota bacterium]
MKSSIKKPQSALSASRPCHLYARVFVIAGTLWACGCLPWLNVQRDASGSLGRPTKGTLSQGRCLPQAGNAFRFYHKYHKNTRRCGLPVLTRMIERASVRVAGTFEGSVLLVGDMSAARGGFISGHRSHRSGRDVDFAFYTKTMAGQEAVGAPLLQFDRFGIGIRNGRAFRFDTQRNWHLVEALLTDPEARVQWIFVSDGLKAMLLSWALQHDRDISLIERAASVLHEPRDALPHDDHFHVRIYCPDNPSHGYCVDTPPVWPWVSRRTGTGERFPRALLAELALD